MGDVIDWLERRRTIERRTGGEAEAGSPGQILLFTGVRYERTVDPFAPPAAPDDSGTVGRPRRRKRR